jgi:peptide deformylase
MALKLIPDSDPRLKIACQPVEDPRSVLDLALEMAEHLTVFSALGLSANQVGRNLALFVMRAPAEGTLLCVNPEWQPLSPERTLMQEACVSYPGQCIWVPRYRAILARWWDPQSGQQRSQALTGQHSQCFQHEWEHLQGRTMWDAAELSRQDRRRLAKLGIPISRPKQSRL